MASQDGRLQQGDRIVSINGNVFTVAVFSELC